jgi:hypothetical protein
MQLRETLERAKARHGEMHRQLLDESDEFYLYDRMPPGEARDRLERSLWETSKSFRGWSALGSLIASYEHVRY